MSRWYCVVLLFVGVILAAGPVLAGQAWTMLPDPVLDIGAPGAWDSSHVGGPTVVNADGTYMMWYDGRHRLSNGDNPCIGLAASLDGMSWDKYAGNPVIGLEQRWPSALYEPDDSQGHVFKMWWNDEVPQIRYAWSSDGITWYDQQVVFGMGAPGSFDDWGLAAPSVVRVNDTYYMYYFADGSTNQPLSGTVALATSQDGVNWTKHGPVLFAGPSAAWDGWGINQCSVLHRDGLFEMWYTGYEPGTNRRRIGYAASYDGTHFTKYPGNPVLSGPADTTAWNHKVYFPTVFHEPPVYKMWLSGTTSAGPNASNPTRTAYATTSTDDQSALEYLAHFEDDFEDATFTQNNWWMALPHCSPATVGGNGVFKVLGPRDRTGDYWGDVGAIAANGKRYQVDGLAIGADILITANYAGFAWGSQGIIGDPSSPNYGNFADYDVYFSPASDKIKITECSATQWGTLAQATVPGIEFNTWYHFELVSTETHFQVWFGPKGGQLSKVIDVAQDVLHPGMQAFSAGTVAVYGTNALFDDFFLQGIPDPVRQLSAGFVRALREEPARVPIWLNDAEGVAGAQFDLYYDPSLLTGLTPPEVEKGSLIAGDPNWALYWTLVAPGHLRVMAYNMLSQPLPAGAHGEIVQAWFTVNPAAAPRSMGLLNVEGVVLADHDGNPIPSLDTDGLFWIARAAEWYEIDPVPTPQCGDATHPWPFALTIRAKDEYGDPATLYNGSALLSDLTGTIAPAAAAFTAGLSTGNVTIGQPIGADRITATDTLDSYVTGTSNWFTVIGKGDPTGDGQTNVLDVVRTVNIALGTMTVSPPEYAAADVNSDGTVNVLDVVRIVNMALGLGAPPAPGGMAALSEAAAGKAARAAGSAAIAPVAMAPVVAAGPTPAPTARKIAVPILIDKAKGVAGFNFDLVYDSRALTPVEVRAGSLIAGKPDCLLNANLGKNPLKVLAFSNQAKALTGGSGTLVEIIFGQTGEITNNSLRLSGIAISGTGGAALARTLTIGKPRPLK